MLLTNKNVFLKYYIDTPLGLPYSNTLGWALFEIVILCGRATHIMS